MFNLRMRNTFIRNYIFIELIRYLKKDNADSKVKVSAQSRTEFPPQTG